MNCNNNTLWYELCVNCINNVIVIHEHGPNNTCLFVYYHFTLYTAVLSIYCIIHCLCLYSCHRTHEFALIKLRLCRLFHEKFNDKCKSQFGLCCLFPVELISPFLCYSTSLICLLLAEDGSGVVVYITVATALVPTYHKIQIWALNKTCNCIHYEALKLVKTRL